MFLKMNYIYMKIEKLKFVQIREVFGTKTSQGFAHSFNIFIYNSLF